MLLCLVISCKDDESDPEVVLSSEKTITSFTFKVADNVALAADVTGTITGLNITCNFPAGTSIDQLKPTIVHTGKSVTPASGVVADFSNPINYTVTAMDGSTATYSITVTVPVPTSQPSVYVAGADRSSGTHVATVWKNGEAISFTNGSFNSFATSVHVDDKTIYVSGTEAVGYNYATYWKKVDGVPQPIAGLNETMNDASANSMFVNGTDVYIAGYENQGAGVGNVAKVWKNGTATHLSTLGSYALSVFVSGNDVYVAGAEHTDTGTSAMLWKNGTGTNLLPTIQRAFASAVTVSDGKVYVAIQYYEGTTPHIKVWVDGTEQTIPYNPMGSTVSSIFVSDGDVYLAGTDGVNNIATAALWKNGVVSILSNNKNSFTYAKSVCVYNDDVYVAGLDYDANGIQMGILWKNGVATTLTHNGSANYVMVK